MGKPWVLMSTYTISDLSEASKCLSMCIQRNLCNVLHLGNLKAACHFYFWREGIPPTSFHMAQDDFILTSFLVLFHSLFKLEME